MTAVNPRLCRIFRHKNPLKDSTRGDEEISVPILLAVKGDKAHGLVAWAQNGRSERHEVVFDLDASEFVLPDEFVRRKEARAEANRRQHALSWKAKKRQTRTHEFFVCAWFPR